MAICKKILYYYVTFILYLWSKDVKLCFWFIIPFSSNGSIWSYYSCFRCSGLDKFIYRCRPCLIQTPLVFDWVSDLCFSPVGQNSQTSLADHRVWPLPCNSRLITECSGAWSHSKAQWASRPSGHSKAVPKNFLVYLITHRVRPSA